MTDQAENSNVQDLAEKSLWEFSEIMKYLESIVKEGSEIAKETEYLNDDMEEGQLINYFNELCRQMS